MKTNKIKFSSIGIGSKFYKFSKHDPEQYTIYIVSGKTRNPNMINLVSLDDHTVTETMSYDDYLNNTSEYTLIDGYKSILLTLTKYKGNDRLHVKIDSSKYVDTFISFTKYNNPELNESYSYKIIVSIYDYTKKSDSELLCELVETNFNDYISQRRSKLSKTTSKILSRDNPIPEIMWNYIRFGNLSNPLFYIDKISLKEFTVDHPDNKLDPEFMERVIKHTNISKTISAYELFEYDESIDLNLIKYKYLIIYSIKDDAFYVFLYTEGVSLYLKDYDTDEDTKEVVDFMFRRGKE